MGRVEVAGHEGRDDDDILVLVHQLELDDSRTEFVVRDNDCIGVVETVSHELGFDNGLVAGRRGIPDKFIERVHYAESE